MEITGPSALKPLRLLLDRRRGYLRVLRVFDPKTGSSFQGGASIRARPSAKAGCAHRKGGRPEGARCPIAPSRPRRRNGRLAPVRSTSSTWRSGRPASSCRRGSHRADDSRKDYEHDGEAASLSNMKNPCALRAFHPRRPDRPPLESRRKVTLHFGRGRQASVLLPVIPPK